jgi:hypothetical protein
MSLVSSRVFPYLPMECPHRLEWTQVVKVRGRTVFECRGCGVAERAPFWYGQGRRIALALATVLIAALAFMAAPVIGELAGARAYEQEKARGAIEFRVVPAPVAGDRTAGEGSAADRLEELEDIPRDQPAAVPVNPFPWDWTPPKRA